MIQIALQYILERVFSKMAYDYLDYPNFIRERITELRLQKGVSSRDMSLSLGQSASYINKIENRRTLPSLTGFLYICEYFDITPQDFFNTADKKTQKNKHLLAELEKLSPNQFEHISLLINDLTEK